MSENDLSRKIHELRALHNLTLEDIATQVGVGRSTVRKWETGMIANMRRDKIAKLAAALHTTPGYLMGWEDEPSEPNKTPDNIAILPAVSQAPADGDRNVLRLAGRDGSYLERVLSDQQLDLIKQMLAQLPDASDDL